jgi:short-subunit dehydrogenase
MLINNAGVGAAGRFEEESTELIDYMIQLNIRALVLLTRLFIPELKKHPQAYILNMGSLGALMPTPYKSIYCSSKSFIFDFSRALREELRKTSIKVSVVNPGAVPTNPHVIERINNGGIIAKASSIPSEILVRKAITRMMRGKVVIIPGFMINLYLVIGYMIPLKIRIRLIGNIFRRKNT